MALTASAPLSALITKRGIFPPVFIPFSRNPGFPDEILVINNASTDETRAVALQVPHVRVVDEPRKGLVVARETGRRAATGDVLVYLDADCRAPLMWLARIEQRFLRDPRSAGAVGAVPLLRLGLVGPAADSRL